MVSRVCLIFFYNNTLRLNITKYCATMYIIRIKVIIMLGGSIMDIAKDFIGKKVHVTIDRKLGSKHPNWKFIYLNNYGYIPNTMSGDGEELDAYILGVFEPLETFDGICIAVLHRLNEDDDKLIVVPEGKNYTDEQIDCLTEYQERFFKHIIIR